MGMVDSVSLEMLLIDSEHAFPVPLIKDKLIIVTTSYGTQLDKYLCGVMWCTVMSLTSQPQKTLLFID